MRHYLKKGKTQRERQKIQPNKGNISRDCEKSCQTLRVRSLLRVLVKEPTAALGDRRLRGIGGREGRKVEEAAMPGLDNSVADT